MADSQPVHSCTLSESNVYQAWYFEPADEGTLSAKPADGKVYYIWGRQSGKYVDVYELKTAAGSEVRQGYYNGGENQQFRTARDWEKEEWYFYVVDVIAVLTEQKNQRGVSNYWAKLKQRLKEEGADQLLTNCQQLKLKSPKGGRR